MKVTAAGITDVGLKREHNEDAFGVYEDIGLFLVADGMGGHAAGEVASSIAATTLRDFVRRTAAGDEEARSFRKDDELSLAANSLKVGIKLANTEIFYHARKHPETKGMGTTMVAALVDGDTLHVAHVGDSRAYHIGPDGIRRITVDHSYVEQMVLTGQLSKEDAATHPLRNLITRALGTNQEVEVDLTSRGLAPGEMYMLCSDGLSGMLAEDEMLRVIREFGANLDACLEELVRRANEKGGGDNITAVIVRVQ